MIRRCPLYWEERGSSSGSSMSFTSSIPRGTTATSTNSRSSSSGGKIPVVTPGSRALAGYSAVISRVTVSSAILFVTVLVLGRSSCCSAFNIQQEPTSVFPGPDLSLFGFSVALHKENGEGW